MSVSGEDFYRIYLAFSDYVSKYGCTPTMSSVEQVIGIGVSSRYVATRCDQWLNNPRLLTIEQHETLQRVRFSGDRMWPIYSGQWPTREAAEEYRQLLEERDKALAMKKVQDAYTRTKEKYQEAKNGYKIAKAAYMSSGMK